jgi:two-component system chemotaxis response regulator CheB
MMPSFIQEMLYQISSTSPYIIGIVASTGGPVALVELLKQLPVDYPIPIVIVQHISSKFTATFCDWLDMQISLPVQLVFDQMPIQKGVWLPAQERHVLVNKTKFVCEDSEPIQFSKPSGDVLLRSLADVFGTRAMGIVMTGMGQDGGAGLGYLKSKGGQAYVQSPDSCVIPGMVNACMRQCTVDGEMSPDALGVLLAGFIRKASC